MYIKGFVFTTPVPSQLLAESVARRDLNFFFLFYVFTEVTVRTRGTWRHLMPLVTQSGKGSELQCKSQIPKLRTESLCQTRYPSEISLQMDSSE